MTSGTCDRKGRIDSLRAMKSALTRSALSLVIVAGCLPSPCSGSGTTECELNAIQDAESSPSCAAEADATALQLRDTCQTQECQDNFGNAACDGPQILTKGCQSALDLSFKSCMAHLPPPPSCTGEACCFFSLSCG